MQVWNRQVWVHSVTGRDSAQDPGLRVAMGGSLVLCEARHVLPGICVKTQEMTRSTLLPGTGPARLGRFPPRDVVLFPQFPRAPATHRP